MATFKVEAMVYGYRIFQDAWNKMIYEKLLLAREETTFAIFCYCCYEVKPQYRTHSRFF